MYNSTNLLTHLLFCNIQTGEGFYATYKWTKLNIRWHKFLIIGNIPVSLYVQIVLVISCQTRLFEYRKLMDGSTYMNHTPVILNTVAILIKSFLETTSIINFKSRNYFEYLEKFLHSFLLKIQALYDNILSKENPFTCISSKVSLRYS
jgi:hypothetical protein